MRISQRHACGIIKSSKTNKKARKSQDSQALRGYTSGPAAVGIFTNSCRRQNFMTRRSTPCSVTSASTCAPLMSRRQNAARPLRSSALQFDSDLPNSHSGGGEHVQYRIYHNMTINFSEILVSLRSNFRQPDSGNILEIFS